MRREGLHGSEGSGGTTCCCPGDSDSRGSDCTAVLLVEATNFRETACSKASSSSNCTAVLLIEATNLRETACSK